MEQHPVIWTTPEPLWKEAADRSDKLRAPMAAPAILRFATDDFMQEFLGVLATDSNRLGEYRVVPETWRGALTTQTTLAPRKLAALSFQRFAAARRRSNGTSPENQGKKPDLGGDTSKATLKLYQPAHQRYYLVTSCLVCQLAGLPDRKIDVGKQEQSGFVMRRLLKPKGEGNADPATWPEHAWVEDQGTRSWQLISNAERETLRAGEEVLPLFSVNHQQDDQRSRRLLAGLIPVGKREAYLAAGGGPENGSNGVTSLTARKVLLRKEVIEPWKVLLRNTDRQRRDLLAGRASDEPPGRAREEEVSKIQREQVQTTSWYILADLARFLEEYSPHLWQLIISEPTAGQQVEPPDGDVLRALAAARLNSELISALQLLPNWMPHPFYTDAAFPNTLLEALKKFSRADTGSPGTSSAVRVQQSLAALRLEAATGSYDRERPDPVAADRPDPAWPDFLFPLADPEMVVSGWVLPPLIGNPVPENDPDKDLRDEAIANVDAPDLAAALERVDKLAVLILRSVGSQKPGIQPAVPLAAKRPADPLEGWFVIRCVYSRPACGKLHDDVISARTEHFQLAGFFDPDAPARPIRIGLPIDTTPAGLRKFDRNTAFIISDTLCGQMARMKGITFGDLVLSILPWPFHRNLSSQDKGPCDFGMICSLSIPIITICALILLMIMVSLLEMIFHWMPYFITCFPLPGLKAKKP